MEKEDWAKEIEAYEDHIFFINDCFCAYMSLFNAQDKFYDILNHAPLFFETCRYCLQKTFFIELAKMYNGGNEEKSLKKLMNLVEQDRNSFQGECESFYSDTNICIDDFIVESRHFLDEYKPQISNLKARRDKFLAHNDKAYFDKQKNPISDFPISLPDIKILVCFMNHFISSLNLSVNGSRVCFVSPQYNDFESLCYWIQSYITQNHVSK